VYKLILVDDEHFVIKSLESLLEYEKLGFEIVGRAQDGEEALALIQNAKPDLVITDIRMPMMSGIELMERSAEMGASALFIVLTGYADFSYAQKAIKAGAIEYCLKPFDKKEIGNAVMNSISKIDKHRSYLESLPPIDDLKYESTVNKVKKYMDEHYAEDVSLSMLSAKFSFNPSYLSNKFRRETGMSITDYLIKSRVQKACNLLAASSLTIVEIARVVGFEDYHYFARVFKKIVNITATEYRGNRKKQ